MTLLKSSDGLNWNLALGIGVTLVFFMAFSLPSLIVLSVGLLPTGVAFIIDRSDHKSGTFCVGGMNLTGVLPFIIKLWSGTHTVAAAIEIISDIFSLLIMYAAAGFGWMMFLAIPPVIQSFLAVISQTRLKVLRANQKKIIEEWGPEVVAIPDDLMVEDLQEDNAEITHDIEPSNLSNAPRRSE